MNMVQSEREHNKGRKQGAEEEERFGIKEDENKENNVRKQKAEQEDFEGESMETELWYVHFDQCEGVHCTKDRTVYCGEGMGDIRQRLSQAEMKTEREKGAGDNLAFM